MIDFDYIEEAEQEETEETKNEFVIVSDLTAEWAMKKIKRAREEHDRLVELAVKEIQELNEKVQALDARLESETGYLKMKLFEYFNNVQHKETKTQESYKLLSGSLVLKKPTQKMVPD